MRHIAKLEVLKPAICNASTVSDLAHFDIREDTALGGFHSLAPQLR